MTSRKEEIACALETARKKTLWLFQQVPEEFLKRRVHNFYSPIGWHFGHIARTEEYWILCKALGRPCLDEHYTFLFADLPENPKDNRVHLPSREQIVEFLQFTRAMSLKALEETDLGTDDPYLADGYAWEFALQHECQHQETIAEMLALIHLQMDERPELVFPQWKSSREPKLIGVPGGSFLMGSDNRHGYDNEKAAHMVDVAPFDLEQTPVTSYQWTEFMTDNGYERPDLWSPEGWAWKLDENATMPEYWRRHEEGWMAISSMGPRVIHPDEPVGCVSWHEAEAYCKWAGKRLPTEAEWEFAAAFDPVSGCSRIFPWGDYEATREEACFGLNHWGPDPVGSHPAGRSALGFLDMAGGLWEWTSSAFLPYPGFEAFPYDGYSKDHMQGLHKVCRGGSWATAAPILRCSFRNWYVPSYRQGFLGLRVAAL